MHARVFVMISSLLLAIPLFAADSRLTAESQAAKDGAGSISFEGKNIEVSSWSWGVSQSASSSDGGGGVAGKATFKDFTFVKKLDKASAILFLACASGKHIPEVVVSVVDDKGSPIGTIRFEDVLVTDFTTSANGGSTPTESISVNYTKVELKY